MKRILCLLMSLAFLGGFGTGCVERDRPEFLAVVQNHRELTDRTVKDVLAGINEELAEVGNQLTPDQRLKVNDLIFRLNLLKQQSAAMEKYVFTKADQQLLAELMRLRWKDARGGQ